jgi:copper chaperone
MFVMTITLTVPSIACEVCAKTITKAIHNQEPDAQVSIDVPHKRVTVVTTASEESIKAAIANAGHEVAN